MKKKQQQRQDNNTFDEFLGFISQKRIWQSLSLYNFSVLPLSFLYLADTPDLYHKLGKCETLNLHNGAG